MSLKSLESLKNGRAPLLLVLTPGSLGGSLGFSGPGASLTPPRRSCTKSYWLPFTPSLLPCFSVHQVHCLMSMSIFQGQPFPPLVDVSDAAMMMQAFPPSVTQQPYEKTSLASGPALDFQTFSLICSS